MSARFLGMNPEATGTLSDTDHLWNSVRDILLTPLASRVMRREYGSLLPDLLDAPMNATTRLQCMSAVVIALTQWEPRIALNAVDIQWEAGGKAVITLTGTLTESMETVQNTLTLRSDNASR
ncbi:GPW/gp25 family protein [Escherichia coli]|uniref:GPW/gp25 family protein n=1 Tax=Escherichia coli TaxID=562 RepID=UPI0026DEF6BE|nr:GPW/gp25 family protein [Escherichia coli]HDD8416887.1 GPW/gp25 family protein [Escherichia coli]